MTCKELEVKRERYFYYIACAVDYLKYTLTDFTEFENTLESLNKYYNEIKKVDLELLNSKNN